MMMNTEVVEDVMVDGEVQALVEKEENVYSSMSKTCCCRGGGGRVDMYVSESNQSTQNKCIQETKK
jgi:hypothetical protein